MSTHLHTYKAKDIITDFNGVGGYSCTLCGEKKALNCPYCGNKTQSEIETGDNNVGGIYRYCKKCKQNF